MSSLTMADTVDTDDTTPLLFSLPVLVETRLLSFVASGIGGINRLLLLRRTCSTTKEWVDRLPRAVFSRAHVRIGSEINTVKRFMQSPPPFAITTLSLNAKDVIAKNPPAEETELWNKFCTFWAPKLETLNLYVKYEDEEDEEDDYELYQQVSPRLLLLLESPNLRSIRMEEMPSRGVIPASFYKVKELGICMSFAQDDKDEVSQMLFYSELKKNQNLRILETTIHAKDYESIQQFIEFKKEDSRLQITLLLDSTSSLTQGNDEEASNLFRESYVKFANSVVDSKSTIRIKMSDKCNFENLVDYLQRYVAAKMFEKVEIVFWIPTEETLPRVRNLPRLKELTVEPLTGFAAFHEQPMEELTFAPTLEKLKFTRGIRAQVIVFPEALTSLMLQNYFSEASGLLDTLSLLKLQCPNLGTLSIFWKDSGTKVPPVNFDNSHEFAKLKSLTFRADMYVKKDVLEISRAVLLHGLQVETLQLDHLAVCFHLNYKIPSNLPVLDAHLLTQLCEGRLANSLVMCDIANVSVAPDGLPVLERLVSLASANAREREEREGRGRWQHLHRRQFT